MKKYNKQLVIDMVVYAALALLFLWLISFTVGCETYQYTHDPSRDNYKNLLVTINGIDYRGVAVVPRADKYEMIIHPETNIKTLSISSCHLDLLFQGKEIEDRETKKKWYQWGSKGISYTYKIQKDIEDKQACLFQIVAMNAEDKPFDYFAADFLDIRPHVSLPATMACNGKTTYFGEGASICQAGANTFQAIRFSEITNFTSWDEESNEEVDKGPCFDALSSKDGRNYEYKVIPGQCTFYFTSMRKCAGDKYCQHRATFFGVTDYPFRGN